MKSIKSIFNKVGYNITKIDKRNFSQIYFRGMIILPKELRLLIFAETLV